MAEIGYALSSEEHAPNDLVRNARLAEEAGFTFALISDHFHPWIDRQGHSPFVWGVIGGISQATERLRLGTGVTCPTIRIHPAIIAHAAATAAAMMPGRFFLGVGSGENLNEHILGDRWPPVDMRQEMLEEAIEVIRLLWQGGLQTHYGEYYVVENARLYTLPDEPPEVYVAASGEQAAQLAARAGDGLIATSPSPTTLQAFDEAGGAGKPRYAQATFCWGEDEREAIRTAHEWWPTGAIPGQLSQELALPSHFQQAAQLVTEDQIAESIPCGPDKRRVLDSIQEYVDAGYSHVYLHQIGPDQEGFLRFCEREILPELVPAGARG
ncbi:MAG TPA: TIGR03557 family F420-dependent LLM class oxidoreductase [Candidatus Caenarcaniphilales bacterium]|nr:TIGR03557 family F420-dependent LLM class oxidoreductase [Candidatus Caenarcaniphilales bacterium]